LFLPQFEEMEKTIFVMEIRIGHKALITVLGVLVGLFVLANHSFSQSEHKDSFEAYIVADLEKAQSNIDNAIKRSGKGSYEHALALYSYLYLTMADMDEDAFDVHIDETLEVLENLSETGRNQAEALALLSSVQGLRIAHDPWRAMAAGSKSGKYMSAALAKNPGHPMVQKLYAGYLLHAPGMFGGDKEEALVMFQRAINGYEKNGTTTHNWFYLDSVVGLAQTQIKLDDKFAARQTLEKCLRIAPDFGWAKELSRSL